ncbi:MAG: hypothetical protein V7772_09995 [Pseudomonas profundi]|uniref:hypothetical protein n=1 Tax=Pseudomonas profundi TaxID=1981513 RepID=UPI003002705B
MTLFVYVALTTSLLGMSAWLWLHRQPLHLPARGALTAGLVGLLLAAAAALLLVLTELGMNQHGLVHAQRMLGLAAQHLSLPLLGMACLFLALGLHWKPMTWGQIILGLMAFFELARRMQLEQQYHWLVNLVGVAALLFTALLNVRRHRLAAALGVIAAGFLLAPGLLGNEMPLEALFRTSQQASWLIPGFVALGLALGLLSTQSQSLNIQMTSD